MKGRKPFAFKLGENLDFGAGNMLMKLTQQTYFPTTSRAQSTLSVHVFQPSSAYGTRESTHRQTSSIHFAWTHHSIVEAKVTEA